MKKRNEVFDDIYPLTNSIVSKMIECLYPKFYERNKEDIEQEIAVNVINTIDKVIELNKLGNYMVHDKSLNSFFISSVFGATEKTVHKWVEKEKKLSNDSYEQIARKIETEFQSLHDIVKETRKENDMHFDTFDKTNFLIIQSILNNLI